MVVGMHVIHILKVDLIYTLEIAASRIVHAFAVFLSTCIEECWCFYPAIHAWTRPLWCRAETGRRAE